MSRMRSFARALSTDEDGSGEASRMNDEVNEVGLTDINGVKVAPAKLNSEGREFSFQIRFTGISEEANADLKFVYFPTVNGEETINPTLESLKVQGSQTFSRVSVKRLGRLLPDVPWVLIPFMQRGNIASTLQKCCQKVMCFVDLDAAFNPTPSNTDLESENPFSLALKNFGSKSKEKDKDVNIKILRDGKRVAYGKVDHEYKDWVLEMHKTYDVENASGEDEPIIIRDSLNNKALCISPKCKAVRLHKVMKREGMSWERGQNIRILKGACSGVHKTNVYATIEYFTIEDFGEEAGGDTRIICRQINYSEDEGCMLSIDEGTSHLEMRSSSSFPIHIIDAGMCHPLNLNEWNKILIKQREKHPWKVGFLDESDCRLLRFDGESTFTDIVVAGQTPPQQVVAVVRPGKFASSKLSDNLDQKPIVKMGEAMLMEVKLEDSYMNSRDKIAESVHSLRCYPKSREGYQGLYIFQLESNFPDLFKKAGTYNFCFYVGNLITGNKKVVVRPSSTVRSWKVANNMESINIEVGSSFPPCSIARFDVYENQIPFTSVPSLGVKLKARFGFQANIDSGKIQVNLKDGILEVENILVETDRLDEIEPTGYNAFLEILSKDEPFSVSVACKVTPGPPKRVVEMNYLQALENLLPDSTVGGFVLEMSDGYNNHVREGTDVQICVDGYRIQDSMGLIRKVDSCGCVDLSGILKVTSGYGKSVSLSVMLGDEEIFKVESLVEKRELSLVTEIQLTPAPTPLMPAPTFERDDFGCPTPFSKAATTPQSGMALNLNLGVTPTPSLGLDQTPCSQFGVLAVRASLSSQTGMMDIVQYSEYLTEKLDQYDELRMEVSKRLKCLEIEHEFAEQKLRTFQASLEPIAAPFPECLSTRESMMKQIEEKHQDTAAAILCCLYKKTPPPQSLLLSKKGVFGIVALLGSVASTSLSRVLSVYLGKDNMLGLVCKSSEFGLTSSEYKMLQDEAARLKRSITDRFLILCMDGTRPWSGGIVENDPQKRLAMDHPCLSNGEPIPGFIGYAVNMVHLTPEDLEIQTKTGCGLRETLFYGLFGDLQVYETGEHLQAALPHINGEDAVSLDGVIFKENGFVYSGCCTPEIHFPITVTEMQEKVLVKMEITRDRKRKAEKMIVEENSSLKKVVKKLKKTKDKYQRLSAAVAESKG